MGQCQKCSGRRWQDGLDPKVVRVSGHRHMGGLCDLAGNGMLSSQRR